MLQNIMEEEEVQRGGLINKLLVLCRAKDNFDQRMEDIWGTGGREGAIGHI